MKLTMISLKNFIQEFLTAYLRLINNVFVRNALTSPKIPSHLITTGNIVVLGNGPSLQADFDKLCALTVDNQFFAVNNFAQSDKFNQVKPIAYIFMDDYFINEPAHPDWQKTRTNTFKSLNEKVTWPMILFVPSQCNINFLRSKIKNKQIKIHRIYTAQYLSKNPIINHIHYKSGIFGPFQGNVLIYAIFISLRSKIKNISIYGADMNFHENVNVDQNTNELYINFDHFYGRTKQEAFKKNPMKEEPFSIKNFELTMQTFQAHYQLSLYAKRKNINVINKSCLPLDMLTGNK